ncbi:MAG: M15 family metallopeptidase [Sandaracinaceae bacterium]|nr:M15 family metallopeptidase [Sandaracinaceae bacterium]
MNRSIRLALFASILSACAAEVGGLDVHGGDYDYDDPDAELAVVSSELALGSMARSCSTAGTEGISRQLVDEMLCLSGGSLVRVSHPNVIPTHSRVHLYLSPQGRDALLSVARTQPVRINSAFRTLAEQYVLSRGCSVAAQPGRSNHETGRAIDVQNYSTVGPALRRAGFSWPMPSSDPVHYDAPGADQRRLSVLAFQRLWNANNPGDRIAEDGVAGSGTLARLARAPAEGFRVGRVCSGGGASPAPAPSPSPSPPPSSSGATCSHSYGGTYGHMACSASYQCCNGSWRTRGSSGCGTCTCTEGTGATGCGVSTPPPPPPSGASCTHSYGGRYGHLACSASYQCCNGSWRDRSSGCGTCACVETSGTRGCG